MWVYDSAGNIRYKKIFAYTTAATLGTPTQTITYAHGNSAWTDLLTAVGNQAYTYDEIGNLLSDGKRTYTWQHGRQLATLTQDNKTWSITYDSQGMRANRTAGSTAYKYYYCDGKLISMTCGDDTLFFSYTPDGLPYGVEYNGTQYVYALNLQGDVMAILNTSGQAVVNYTYDAWGNVLSVTESMAATLGEMNPLRYRGYVYDEETGLYYLQSRYYDPEIGRFINADGYTSTGQGFTGNNMFAYCGNNPVCRSDYSGDRYCEATTIAGESKDAREESCAYQNKVARERAFRTTYAEELDVLEGRSSTYKGIPVITTPAMDNAAFTYGVIFIGEGITDPILLRHEYGHIIQSLEIGMLGYTKYVVIPSVACFWGTELGVLPGDAYYNLPWEHIADRYGGANRTTSSFVSDIANIYWGTVKGIGIIEQRIP